MADDPVDVLYGLPLDEFVAERNRLAKERKDPSLRKLRKPSVAAWHVNQLARTRTADVERLVDAAGGIRRAQQRALSGVRTGGADLREANREHRAVVDALVDGVPANLVERVRSTLTAASLDEDVAPALLAGRLVDDVEPAGFGDLTGLELLTSPEAGEEADEEPEPDPHAAERTEIEHELAEARDALRAARDREVAARAEMDRAYDAVRDAERAVADLESRLADLG